MNSIDSNSEKVLKYFYDNKSSFIGINDIRNIFNFDDNQTYNIISELEIRELISSTPGYPLGTLSPNAPKNFGPGKLYQIISTGIKFIEKQGKFKDNGYNIKNVKGHVTITNVKGDHNITTVSVGEFIKTDNKVISRLNPEFGNSIEEFRDLLKEKLKDRQATEEQVLELNKNIDKLAKELEGINADQIIEDEDKKDDIKSKLSNLAEAVVDIAPDVAECIASLTPLSPVSKAIGKGIGYVSDLVKRKLKKE